EADGLRVPATLRRQAADELGEDLSVELPLIRAGTKESREEAEELQLVFLRRRGEGTLEALSLVPRGAEGLRARRVGRATVSSLAFPGSRERPRGQHRIRERLVRDHRQRP